MKTFCLAILLSVTLILGTWGCTHAAQEAAIQTGASIAGAVLGVDVSPRHGQPINWLEIIVCLIAATSSTYSSFLHHKTVYPGQPGVAAGESESNATEIDAK